MRKPASREHYENELLYCELIDPLNPGPTFNDDPECFQRYCNLQAKLAFEDGFGDLFSNLLDSIPSAPDDSVIL